ncbi:hypothetical protein Mal4_06630 [Maioricimonas rarisocia]|uniref:Biopolymer transport protein ExbD/TolR n=1 Tax=Maioricimonas rarisocia TaxID=2528026 RepID=A0A517Z1N3_9PLAN|nr:hypothetical protein [Maioricimonas rarisocia]QDU36378.1 hypothetical protein Mal4_06630 [Maioricimonas rarisocia]
MRKRIAGGVTLAVVAVAIWIGTLLKGPGVGGGTGSDVATGPPVKNASVSVSTGSSDLMGDDAEPRAEEPAPASDEKVAVLIKESDFHLKTGEDAWEPVSLARVRELTQNAHGDGEGVRVEVYLHETARNGARSDLLEALQQDGVLRESINLMPGFVE